MIARALEADLPFGWVTADEAYGQVGRLRSWLEEHGLAHVLAVPKSQMVISMDLRQRRAHAVIAELSEYDWERLSCGDGAHGQRLYDWAAIDIRPWRPPGMRMPSTAGRLWPSAGYWSTRHRHLTHAGECALGEPVCLLMLLRSRRRQRGCQPSGIARSGYAPPTGYSRLARSPTRLARHNSELSRSVSTGVVAQSVRCIRSR
jgi:hypothetical protein